MFTFLNDYRKLERSLLNVITAEFFIQMVNATFMNILPLYMKAEGYAKEQIAMFITFRFIGVFALAIPLGNYLRGKKMKPFFYLSAVLVPTFALCIVIATWLHLTPWIYASLICWGASFTFMQIPISPYILRNAPKENHTAGIALSYSTWSFAGIASGVLIALLDFINPQLFNERTILVIFSVLGFGGLWFMSRVKIQEKTEDRSVRMKQRSEPLDWPLIIRGLIPTLIIATGAGLTIPFISLFFSDVHGIQKGGFSVISSIAAVLVVWGALMVPRIKVNIGYKIAIPATQSLAVVSLIALATTELYSQYAIALYIAIICYLLRQPLMNMAGPMTTELLMKYVGRKNQEMTSALVSAIWSGSWFFSGLMVSFMFGKKFDFVNIFLITALLYAFGVVLYYLLILDYNKREKQGLIE
ncbi:MAG: MFS transporter [Bacteroidetes bacterium]|nr:MFS transporter [Bacteroidota bacterium]